MEGCETFIKRNGFCVDKPMRKAILSDNNEQQNLRKNVYKIDQLFRIHDHIGIKFGS
jgi:hypothetical protein